jgi:hypothetical protein
MAAASLASQKSNQWRPDSFIKRSLGIPDSNGTGYALALRIHHKANSIGSGHASADHDYLHAVAESIADAGAILITGPANAKTELVKHIHNHDPKLINVIVGVETVDHPSDAQLVAYAKKYFNATDRMQPQL